MTNSRVATNAKIQELYEKTKKAIEDSKKHDEFLARFEGEGAEPHHIFLAPKIKEDDENFFAFLVLQTHPDDDSMIFCVLVDYWEDWVGSLDVRIKAHGQECDYVARCNYGFWVHRDKVDQKRIHVADTWELVACRDKIIGMIDGSAPDFNEDDNIMEAEGYEDTMRRAVNQINAHFAE